METRRSVSRFIRNSLFSQPTKAFVSSLCPSMEIHSEVWALWDIAAECEALKLIPLEIFYSPSATNASRSSCGVSIHGIKVGKICRLPLRLFSFQSFVRPFGGGWRGLEALLRLATRRKIRSFLSANAKFVFLHADAKQQTLN